MPQASFRRNGANALQRNGVKRNGVKTSGAHYELRIRREALKFSSAHMTVFPDGSKEALHGHQYIPTVTVRFQNAEFKSMIPFSEIKRAMKKIAALWDEKVLLAIENPKFKLLKQSKTSLEFELCKKRYVLPRDEVVCLKIDNVTCEALAEAYFDFLCMELEWLTASGRKKHPAQIDAVKVYIEESAGQGAEYAWFNEV